ncbi:dienelactone hydrolase [Diaporthe sp. PMI_573]|nr:dienelactone hydrolase [Diaporthaceae sp. PMI_573]
MASNPPGKCCVAGIKHHGMPQGELIKVADKWDAYLATPPADNVQEGAGILFLPDVLGIYENSKLMADQFAANGFVTMVIDLFNGDPVPLGSTPDFDLMKWVTEGSDGKNPHTVEAVDPIVEAAIKSLTQNYGVKKLGAVGYCYGAKFVVRHYKNGIKAGYLAHPSWVEEEELAAISGPLSIAAAETDPIFPTDKRQKSEEILKSVGHPYQVNLYSSVAHGFAVRGDMSKRIERFAKEQAFYQAVAWFTEFLQ